MSRRFLWMAALAAVALAPSAYAQEREKEPIGKFVADARVALPRFTDDETIAASIGVTAENMPGRGLGFSVGAHVYPFRLGGVTFGFGAELLRTRGHNTLEPIEEGGPDGPTVESRFSSFSPQVSLNFGSRRGWSYVSGGIGWTNFTIENQALPVADADGSTKSINYGGGARWFAKEHLAFTFDMRFHRIDPQPASAGRPPYPGLRMFIISAGVSFK